jgi:hypothetical protein
MPDVDLSLPRSIRQLFQERNMRALIDLVNDDGCAYADKILTCACFHGWYGLVKYLVENTEVNINAYDDAPLRSATQCGSLELTKYLIEHGAVANNRTLVGAAVCGFIDVVKYLVEQVGVKPEENDNRAYRHARQVGQKEVVQYLREFQ